MKLKVAFLDVFHGDCAVVSFDEGDSTACIVVDGGQTVDAARRLAAYLKQEEIEIIDLMVATHIDADHVRGLLHLLEKNSGKSTSWNKGEKRCIRYYWGPKPDPAYTGKKTTKTDKTKMTDATKAQSGSDIGMLEHVILSVDENQRLHEFVEEHIFESGNIYYPSLDDPPPLDIFDNVEITLLAPDAQIDDTKIKSMALTVSNAPYKRKAAGEPVSHGKRLTLSDLRHIVEVNAEEMATIANRTANNQSIVFKLTPGADSSSKARKWTFLFTGDAEHESWDMMTGRAEIKDNLPSKVLKVPHHGSVNGIDEGSFMVIKPEYSIVSVGQKHGLPDGATLSLINRAKSRHLFCTERNAKDNGPCWDASGAPMTGCVRADESCYRSVLFEIDLETGTCDKSVFGFSTGQSPVDVTDDEMWCNATGW